MVVSCMVDRVMVRCESHEKFEDGEVTGGLWTRAVL